MGKEENNFMVTEGRFGNVSTIYDPDRTLVDDRIVPSYNPYGYMTSASNYQVPYPAGCTDAYGVLPFARSTSPISHTYREPQRALVRPMF